MVPLIDLDRFHDVRARIARIVLHLLDERGCGNEAITMPLGIKQNNIAALRKRAAGYDASMVSAETLISMAKMLGVGPVATADIAVVLGLRDVPTGMLAQFRQNPEQCQRVFDIIALADLLFTVPTGTPTVTADRIRARQKAAAHRLGAGGGTAAVWDRVLARAA